MDDSDIVECVTAALSVALRPLRSRDLAAIVYADDPDGGPLAAESRIRNAIARKGDGRIVSTPGGYALSPNRSERPRRCPRDERRDEIRRMRRQRFTYAEIGKRFGISERYACRLCMKDRV